MSALFGLNNTVTSPTMTPTSFIFKSFICELPFENFFSIDSLCIYFLSSWLYFLKLFYQVALLLLLFLFYFLITLWKTNIDPESHRFVEKHGLSVSHSTRAHVTFRECRFILSKYHKKTLFHKGVSTVAQYTRNLE